MRRILAVSLVFLTIPVLADDKEKAKLIIPEGAKLEKVWGEGTFTEGPAYGPGGFIFFTDNGEKKGRIMKFDPNTSKTTVFREDSGRANGLDFNPDGHLIAAEGANGGNRRVTITDMKTGKAKPLCDKWDGKRFNSPNDVTVHTNGRVYFSDPRFGNQDGREIDTQSVYRVDPDGKVTQIITDVTKPNGVLLSPDMKTLYVADTDKDGAYLLAYPVREDGTVAAKKVLYNFGKQRGIDGMVCDVQGNIYGTAGKEKAAGLYIISPEGKLITIISTLETPTNCVFGDKDRKTMYITAGKSLYKIKLNIQGYAVYWPKDGGR